MVEVEKPEQAPQAVRDAATLWVYACILQAVLGVANGVEFATNRSYVAEMSKDMVQDMSSGLAGDFTDALGVTAGVLTGVSSLIIAGLFFFFIRKYAAGRPWARTVLQVGSVYLILQVVWLAFGMGDLNSQWFNWTYGVLTILSGVTAGLGLWFSSQPART